MKKHTTISIQVPRDLKESLQREVAAAGDGEMDMSKLCRKVLRRHVEAKKAKGLVEVPSPTATPVRPDAIECGQAA